MAMIYSQEDLTSNNLSLPHSPFLGSFKMAQWLHIIPFAATFTSFLQTHKHTHTRPHIHTVCPFLKFFYKLGSCICGLPCPLKRALINGYFINQEIRAVSKRLWGQGSAEVLNQFPDQPGLDIFCFLAARWFIIILPLRRNGTGREGGLDVKQGYRWWEGCKRGSKQ